MMRSVVLALLLTLGGSLPGQARVRTLAPPGNSAVSQYLEDIPTADGSRPTDTVQPGAGSQESNRGGRTAQASGAVSPSTSRVLALQGPDGVAAVALARATAPSEPRRPGGGGERGGGPVSMAANGGGSAPVGTVAKTLIGSSGGLGPLLAIILIASLLGGGVLALLRRRRRT
jgi:hypothetical protein